MGLKEKTMNIYLSNLIWSFTTGYLLCGTILGIFCWGFFTVWTVKKVEDTQYVDVWEDIVIPLFIGFGVSIVLVFCWGFLVPFALLFGFNLLIVQFIIKIIVPIYKFIKDLPIMDRRKGEDV